MHHLYLKTQPLIYFFFLYLFNKSTISNSFLFEGLSDLLICITLLSKKYKPVIAKFDFEFFGFSLIEVILLLTFKLAIPKSSGLLTG